MLRGLFAIIAGYLLFATASIALFAISGRDPYAAAPAWFVASSTVYGMIAATASGYMAASLARRDDNRVPAVLAVVIALGALASLSAGHPGAHWSQWANPVSGAASGRGGSSRGERTDRDPLRRRCRRARRAARSSSRW